MNNSIQFFIPLLGRVTEDNTGRIGYVMPWCEDGSLADFLGGKQLVGGEEWSLKVLRAIAIALEKAHSQGFIHNDIKPHNILCFRRQFVLSDWGMAWMLSDEKLTQLQGIYGTRMYKDPLVAQNTSLRSDPKSDLYSLGIMLQKDLCSLPVRQSSLVKYLYQKLCGDWNYRFPNCKELITTIDWMLQDPGNAKKVIASNEIPKQVPLPRPVENDPVPLLLLGLAGIVLLKIMNN